MDPNSKSYLMAEQAAKVCKSNTKIEESNFIDLRELDLPVAGTSDSFEHPQ